MHILQTLDALQHRNALRCLPAIIARKRRIQILPHVDDDGRASGTPAEKDIVLAILFAHLLGDLRQQLIGHAGARHPERHRNDPKIFSERMTQQGDGLRMQFRLGCRVKIEDSRNTERSGNASI